MHEKYRRDGSVSIENIFDFFWLASAVKSYFVLLLVFAAVFGAAMSYYTDNYIIPVYNSETTLSVNNSVADKEEEEEIDPELQPVGLDYHDINAAQSLVNTYVALSQSNKVFLKAADNLNKDEEAAEEFRQYSVRNLMRRVEITGIPDTVLFKVIVSHYDPDEAVRIADEMRKVICKQLPTYVEGSSVRVTETPVAADEPSSPNKIENVAFGVIAGLLFGMMLAVILKLRDNKLKDASELEHITDLAVLGEIAEITVK